jgi:peptidoglycan/xylan/chitin deacetylase (PgdA/CDA1 family)
VFAVANMVGTTRQFWPNRLARLLTTPGLERGDPSFAWLQPLPGYAAAGALSTEAIAAVIDACKRFSDPQLAARLERMEAAVALPASTAPALMDWSQLQRMQESGLVDIGSHTRHHFRLGGDLPAQLLQDEIAGSRTQLEQMLGRPVKLFCYPNGDVSRPAAELVGRNYLAAVTTRRGINSATTPAHALSRIGVHEHIGNTDRRFQARLSGWM